LKSSVLCLVTRFRRLTKAMEGGWPRLWLPDSSCQ
jgi:hypothetical protein